MEKMSAVGRGTRLDMSKLFELNAIHISDTWFQQLQGPGTLAVTFTSSSTSWMLSEGSHWLE